MIGKLDRRIEVYTQTTATNTYGEKVDMDSLLVTIWAGIETAGGSEKIEGDKATSTRVIRFTIRRRTGLTEKMKIKYDGNWYQITAIEELDRMRYLQITGERKC